MKYLLVILFLVVGVLMRVFPFAPNFTPLLSIALLCGMYTKNKYYAVLPILIMLLSDLYLGNHITAIWVYSSFVFIFIMGYFLTKKTYAHVIGFSILSSLLFFVVTNFGVWITGGYPYNLNGLISCYAAAIPFYKNTLISTLLFSILINYVVNAVPQLNKQLRAN